MIHLWASWVKYEHFGAITNNFLSVIWTVRCFWLTLCHGVSNNEWMNRAFDDCDSSWYYVRLSWKHSGVYQCFSKSFFATRNNYEVVLGRNQKKLFIIRAFLKTRERCVDMGCWQGGTHSLADVGKVGRIHWQMYIKTTEMAREKDVRTVVT